MKHPWLDDAGTIERVNNLWALQRQQRHQDESTNGEDLVDDGGKKREAFDDNSNGIAGETDSVSRAAKRIRVDLQVRVILCAYQIVS